MPRFFFDVSDGRCSPDTEGIVFVDQIAARREAMRRSAMLLKAAYCKVGASTSWRIGVRDENGVEIYWIKAGPPGATDS